MDHQDQVEVQRSRTVIRVLGCEWFFWIRVEVQDPKWIIKLTSLMVLLQIKWKCREHQEVQEHQRCRSSGSSGSSGSSDHQEVQDQVDHQVLGTSFF
jgi:hypothetical protein